MPGYIPPIDMDTIINDIPGDNVGHGLMIATRRYKDGSYMFAGETHQIAMRTIAEEANDHDRL